MRSFLSLIPGTELSIWEIYVKNGQDVFQISYDTHTHTHTLYIYIYSVCVCVCVEIY